MIVIVKCGGFSVRIVDYLKFKSVDGNPRPVISGEGDGEQSH